MGPAKNDEICGKCHGNIHLNARMLDFNKVSSVTLPASGFNVVAD